MLCAPSGGKLQLEPLNLAGDEVLDGRLIDPATGNWYRIEDGIADLAPPLHRDAARYAAFCQKFGFPAPTTAGARAAPDANYAKQTEFFSSYKEGYEKDVVQSPFYDILYRTTIDRWLQRNLANGVRVAEVGCGSGHQTLHILRRGGNVVGVDLSEEMLREARQKVIDAGYAGRAEFVIGTAEDLPLAERAFDAAVICGSLHHFADPARALLKVSKALKPQGKLYLLEPHKSPARFIFDWTMRRWPLWQEEANDDPLFEAGQFRAWLKAGGIDCRIRYSTYLPPHLFYVVNGAKGDFLLSSTDRFFGSIPGLRRFAGVIIAEGVKA